MNHRFGPNGADILDEPQLAPQGLAPVRSEDTEHFTVTRDFLLDHGQFLRRLLGRDEA